MSADQLDDAESSALEAKQKHWRAIKESFPNTVEIPVQPRVRSINDYPLGRFGNLERNRIRWVAANWFEFIPKANNPFTFIRSTGEHITPQNFFTDGGSIPRLFQWSDELDPFGSLPPFLLHDWEFDLHHCKKSKRTFEDAASICMEAMRTLMEGHYIKYNTFVFWMIETGINSWIAQRAWDNMPPKCPIPPYKPE